jgi:hypothetical protein
MGTELSNSTIIGLVKFFEERLSRNIFLEE